MHIKQGEKIAIVGESGSGKTTLLNIIHGEETPTSGQISFAGQTCPVRKSRALVPISSKIAITLIRYLWKTNILLGLDKKQETLNHILKKQDWNI